MHEKYTGEANTLQASKIWKGNNIQKILTFFFWISNVLLKKSAKGRNPSTQEVYKRMPKRS
jgi:hypothetical protein